MAHAPLRRLPLPRSPHITSVECGSRVFGAAALAPCGAGATTIALGSEFRVYAVLRANRKTTFLHPPRRSMFKDPTKKFGRMCLLTRRMAERGVRFIQLYNNDWDGHDACAKKPRTKRRTHRPTHRRSKTTRPPRHHAHFVGRRIRPHPHHARQQRPRPKPLRLHGMASRRRSPRRPTHRRHRRPLGFRAVERKVHIHDLHATMLHALGFDHEKLTYHFEGRARRLTDVFGQVVDEVFA